MVIINCEGGRIGELWWFNSEPGTPREAFVPVTLGIIEIGMVIKRRIVRWGTCGFGRDVTINWEPIDD